MVDDHAAVDLPQDSQQRPLCGGVLKAKRLGPLDEVVGQGTRPERPLGKGGGVGMVERFIRSFSAQLGKNVFEVPRS